MDNLIQLLGEQMTPGVMKSMSGLLGGSEAEAKGGMAAAIPSLIGMMMNQGSSNAGAGQLLDMMTQQDNANNGLDFTDLAGMLGGSGNSDMLMKAGAAMLPALMGGNASSVSKITDLVGSAAGIKTSGMSSKLLRMLAPIALNFVMRRLRSGGNMNAKGIMDLLGGQRKFVEQAAPKGLMDMFGGNDNVVSKAKSAPKVAPSRQVETKRSGGMGKFLLPLLLAGLAFFAWQFMRNRGSASLPSGVTTQLCGNFDSITEGFNGLPTINADTEVAGLSTKLAAVGGIVDKIGAVGGSIAGVDTLVSSFDKVESLIGGISGTTLGDSSTAVDGAITSMRGAGQGVIDGIDCN